MSLSKGGHLVGNIMDLRGIFPPIPTPFLNGDLDMAALASNCDRWLTTGIRGLVVLGSNGEAPFLDDVESDHVIETARARVPTERVLIAGVARESTVGTIRAAARAARLGADAVLVRTPSFFKSFLKDDTLTAHYTAVADASPVPVILYNFTALTGISLSVETVVRLAEHPNVVGMKESGSDIARVSALVDETPTEFHVLAGSAPALYASLLSGAAGGVLALACVVPALCVRLFDLVSAGQLSEARVLQRRLAPLARLVTRVHGVPGLKAALSLVGYIGGEPRAPLRPASPDAVDELRRSLVSLTDVVA